MLRQTALADEAEGWLARLLDTSKKPFVFAINGPQGAGKTTLAAELVRRFRARGGRALAVSIDDFYLTNAAQKSLAQRYPHNPYLQQRGYPGTHDVGLGAATLAALRDLGAGTLAIPKYDKAAAGGCGDRFPREQWHSVEGPLDLVIFEGWMLGFRPLAPAPTDPALAEVNALLAAYAPWHEGLDAFLLLRMAEPKAVVAWRIEAEATLRAAGRGGMSDTAAKAYIERFLPAYSLFPQALAAAPPVPRERFRQLVLGPGRELLY